MLNLTNHENPAIPEPGIYNNVPYSEYDRWNAFRKSLVGAALRSGKHLEYAIKNNKRTAALNFGNLVDCLVLEPHLFHELYALQPSTYSKMEKGVMVHKPWNLRSNTCKDIAEQLHSSGKQIVSKYDYEKALECKTELYSNREFKRSFESSQKQVSIVWNEPNTGILCKARMDMYGNTIDDLKTSTDASQEEFKRLAGRFLYHVQAAIYKDAVKQLTGSDLDFRFFVVETSEQTEKPLVALYEFDKESDSLLAGRLMFQRACEAVARYQEIGFTGYSEFVEPISIPYWQIQQEIDRHEEVEL